MRKQKRQGVARVVAGPWDTRGNDEVAAVRRKLNAKAIAVGLLDDKQPALDQFLAVRGYGDATIKQWCEGPQTNRRLLRGAQRDGCTFRTSREKPADALTREGYAVAVAFADCLPTKRWWFIVACRKTEPFTEAEAAHAYLVLRGWQNRFDRPDEPDMQRFLVGQNDQLLGADMVTQGQLMQRPALTRELLEAVRPPLEQRWPMLKDNDVHDVAILLAGKPTWVRLHRSRATNDPKAAWWHVETRPLEKDELAVVGEVEDERIASAIAFLHENYAKSPSLAATAKHAHMSPFHFHRLFSKQVGVSPKQYAQRKQLQVARWLLRSTRQPIGDIATSTGFSSHGHFTSTFHRVVGQSPSQYRETH